MKLGIIQSRGLGDLVIALPIAHYYYQEGYAIHWPICEEFYPSFKDTVPWVTWYPVPTDSRGEFFYNLPMKILSEAKCDEILCLYQNLSSQPQLKDTPWFQIQKFDEFKYTKAGVPFINKWNLAHCITRNPQREQQLARDILGLDPGPYYVTHLEGSTYTAPIDLSNIPPEWQRVDITAYTDNIWDWLSIIEGAEAVIMLDSVYANIVDQLMIPVEKYWIPRSHIHLTPVLGAGWTILEPPQDSLAAKKIFG